MNLNKIKNINLLFIFIIVLLSLIGTAALYSAGDGNFDPVIFFITSAVLLPETLITAIPDIPAPVDKA